MSRARPGGLRMRPICNGAYFGAVQHEQAVMTGATDVPFLSRFRNRGLASGTVVSPPRFVCIEFFVSAYLRRHVPRRRNIVTALGTTSAPIVRV
jgi:hypothetical protein